MTTQVGSLASLSGTSRVEQLIKDADWRGHAIGDPASWPAALKTLTGVMLRANQAMFVAWSPRHTLIYNDAYIDVLGHKHPGALEQR